MNTDRLNGMMRNVYASIIKEPIKMREVFILKQSADIDDKVRADLLVKRKVRLFVKSSWKDEEMYSLTTSAIEGYLTNNIYYHTDMWDLELSETDRTLTVCCEIEDHIDDIPYEQTDVDEFKYGSFYIHGEFEQTYDIDDIKDLTIAEFAGMVANDVNDGAHSLLEDAVSKY